MDEGRWQHPIHARGIRSPQYFGGHVDGKLTDKKIRAYILAGYYGTEARERLLKGDQ